MNTAAIWGWVGGIAGALIGVGAAAVGTYFSIKNTSGPRERAFMIKLATGGWIAIVLFLGLLFLLPSPYQELIWVSYAIVLPVGIVYGNRQQQAIRREELLDR